MCKWKSTTWRPVRRRTEAKRNNKIFTNTLTFPSSTVESLPPCPRGEMESRKQSLSPSLLVPWGNGQAAGCHSLSQGQWPLSDHVSCLPLSGQFYSDYKGLIDVESCLLNRVKSNSVNFCIFHSEKSCEKSHCYITEHIRVKKYLLPYHPCTSYPVM